MGANPLAGNPLSASGVESMLRFRYQFIVPLTTVDPTAQTRQTSRRRLLRAFAACWLVAFSAFNVGIPVLDAQLEHAGEVVVHWEDAGATSCPVAHDVECVACQAVTGRRFVASTTPALPVAVVRVELAPPGGAVGLLATAARAVPSTRAPPQA
jgi:hypothetical protein